MAALGPGVVLAEQPLSNIDPSAVVSSPQAAPPTPGVNPPPSGEAPGSLDAMPRFVLAKVVFAHAKAVSESELQAAYAGDIGKTVSLADLRAIARRAEEIYARHGFGFVVVVVTPQRVQDGVVRFDVIEGKIAGLSVLGLPAPAQHQPSRCGRAGSGVRARQGGAGACGHGSASPWGRRGRARPRAAGEERDLADLRQSQ
jgi:hemolysin activation/secretion protein